MKIFAKIVIAVTVGWVLLALFVPWWVVCTAVLRGSWVCPFGLGQ